MINGEREALSFRSTSAAGNTLSTVRLYTLSFRTINTVRKYVTLMDKRSLWWGLPQK